MNRQRECRCLPSGELQQWESQPMQGMDLHLWLGWSVLSGRWFKLEDDAMVGRLEAIMKTDLVMRTIMAHNEYKEIGKQQWGSNWGVAYGELAMRVSAVGKDKTGLGHWAWWDSRADTTSPYGLLWHTTQITQHKWMRAWYTASTTSTLNSTMTNAHQGKPSMKTWSQFCMHGRMQAKS